MHFEDYKRALLAALEPAVEIFSLSQVQRVGLRYVNKIPIPKKDASKVYHNYVRSPIEASVLAPHQLNSFLTEISVDLTATKKLTIRSGLLPAQSDTDSRTYLLDLDCSSPENISLSAPTITGLLDEYHQSIEAEFHRAMTDKYWTYIAEGKAM